MLLSIVTTLYQSEETILDFYTQISDAAQSIAGQEYEIIFVNDGSNDLSLNIALDLNLRYDNVCVVDLSKNFGHHRALMVGLEYSQADHIFLIDSDLEESPKELIRFYNELNSDPDVDVVYGVQGERKGNFLERMSGLVFYKFFNFFSDIANIPKNFSTIRIMRKSYVEALLCFKDKEIHFAPLADLAGFNQREISIIKGNKKKTTYSFSKKYHLFINQIFSYSSKPLYFIFYLGILITSFSNVTSYFSIGASFTLTFIFIIAFGNSSFTFCIFI